MARPKKTGLDYFPFDVDFFSNRKIRVLRAKYGLEGMSVFMFLLCEIYRNGYYVVWDEDYKLVLTDELGISYDSIEKIVDFMTEKSLLTVVRADEKVYLTSKGIQERYQLAVKQRATRRNNIIPVDRKIWLLNDNETENYICLATNPCLSCDKSLKESKVNESKEKQSKENESKSEESRVNDSTEKDSCSDEKTEQHISTDRQQTSVHDVTDLFNTVCKSLKPVTTVSQTTEQNIRRILENSGDFDFGSFFERVERSDFLTGRNGRWNVNGVNKATFNWIIKPENVQKILSGIYDNNTPAKNDSIGDSLDYFDTNYDDYLDYHLQSKEWVQ